MMMAFLDYFIGTGHPGMNITLVLNERGLPLGIQLVGPYWSEMEMIHLAKQLTKLTPGFIRSVGY
jgi:Asp-tRNA(Asn)/Glu-tRNA(Gln) amidotransferase A subunit family amidase